MNAAETAMKMTVNPNGGVRLIYNGESLLGDTIQIVREFTCPYEGGYVIEHLENGETRQVCDGLAGMGNTLHSYNRAALGVIIRREYRVMKAKTAAHQ